MSRQDFGPLFEEVATELAIMRVEDANSPDPLEMAEADAIKTLSALPQLVSSDTILPNLAQYGFTDNRAMGPIMRRLIRAGHLTATGEFRKSQRPGNHRVPKAMYQNKLYDCKPIQETDNTGPGEGDTTAPS